MKTTGRRLHSVRQDWVREKIRYDGHNRYEVLDDQGCFLTRKGIPKGLYILRINLKSALSPGTTVVSIEPAGGSKASTKHFKVERDSTESCQSFPLVVSQRSRVRVQPTGHTGAIEAVISVVPTTRRSCLRLLRHWTQGLKQNQSDLALPEPSLSEEITLRASQLFRGKLLQPRFSSKQRKASDQPKTDSSYEHYLNTIEPYLKASQDQVDRWLKLNPDAPLISIVIPTYNTNPDHLRACINSIEDQLYPHWEICICDDNSSEDIVRSILNDYSSTDQRIKTIFRNENGHISNASNDALELATGEYVALLDHDDLLANDALYWVAKAIRTHPFANLIYSDEDKIEENGRRSCPHFKPAFNIDLLLSYNYISHLGVYRRRTLQEIGGFRVGLEGSQDHDLALRTVLTSSPDQIVHVPRILYHWRIHPESTASDPNSKDYTSERGLKAVQHYLDEQQKTSGCSATATKRAPNRYRCHWHLPQQSPSVDLIIPTRDRAEILELAVYSILERTDYDNYTITIVDNQSCEAPTFELFQNLQKKYPDIVRVIPHNKEFNYSAINNAAVKQSKADFIGLINNDIEAITADWLTEMTSLALRPDVGCVGAKLLYSNDTIQHGGVVIGIGDVAGHAHKYFPKDNPGYVDRLHYTQQMTAVTAACLIVRREIFNEVGGLNEKNLSVAFNDVDFCLRVHSKGYRNIFTPFAQLYHHESISRGTEDTPQKRQRFNQERQYMLDQYDTHEINQLPVDLFYSPSLTKTHENFTISNSLIDTLHGIRAREEMRSARSYYQPIHAGKISKRGD